MGLGAVIGWGIYAWLVQLRLGLTATGMNDKVIWGFYIANFIFFIGIAFAGIAIAAGIKIIGLKKYDPLVRMAELLTVVATLTAVLSLTFDLGRPDRVFNLLKFYPYRVGQSPLAWDLTAIGLYLLLSVTFLYLPLRRDLKLSYKSLFGHKGWLNRLQVFLHDKLLLAYRGKEPGIERLESWLALAILPIVVMLHSIIGWVFSLMVSQPGWFNPLYAPAFVLAALTSGVAVLIVIAGSFRRTFGWEEILKDEIFKGLSSFLAALTLFYLYFMFSTELGANFAGTTGQLATSKALLEEEFALPFWAMTICGFFLPSLWLIIQALKPKVFRMRNTVVLAGLIALSFWVKRVLIVVPPLTRPNLPFTRGIYIPTWVEWSLVGLSFAVTILFYLIFIKLLPILPIKDLLEGEE